MVQVFKNIDPADGKEQDELLTVCDRQFLHEFLCNHCKDNNIKFETRLNPEIEGKYLIYHGSERDIYEVIEMKNGIRQILYILLIC